jgi:hypothetical protein
MGTRADFFIGVGPAAKWVGSVSYNGWPDDDGAGAEPMAATSEAEFRAAVERVLSTWHPPVTRPEEGWPWPWEDFRTTDWAYAWDRARGPVTSQYGHDWMTARQLKELPRDLSYRGQRELRDDEVPDMTKGKKADVLAKSGLMLLKVPT